MKSDYAKTIQKRKAQESQMAEKAKTCNMRITSKYREMYSIRRSMKRIDQDNNVYARRQVD